jgi:cytochrome c1
MRYNRLRDIGLTEDQIKKNLLFATEKVGDNDEVALDPQQAKAVVRRVPPDLTVIARSRAGAAARVPDYSTPTCAATTATTPRPPAGTTSLPRTSHAARAVGAAGQRARCSRK